MNICCQDNIKYYKNFKQGKCHPAIKSIYVMFNKIYSRLNDLIEILIENFWICLGDIHTETHYRYNYTIISNIFFVFGVKYIKR